MSAIPSQAGTRTRDQWPGTGRRGPRSDRLPGSRANAIRVALPSQHGLCQLFAAWCSVMSPDLDPYALRELRRFLASCDAGGGGSDETESSVKEGDDDPTMDSGGSTSAGGGSRTRRVRVGRRDSVDSERDERHPQAGEWRSPPQLRRSARLLKREVHRHRRIHAAAAERRSSRGAPSPPPARMNQACWSRARPRSCR